MFYTFNLIFRLAFPFVWMHSDPLSGVVPFYESAAAALASQACSRLTGAHPTAEREQKVSVVFGKMWMANSKDHNKLTSIYRNHNCKYIYAAAAPAHAYAIEIC